MNLDLDLNPLVELGFNLHWPCFAVIFLSIYGCIELFLRSDFFFINS